MRITGLHVDGFGALCDLRIDDLSPGLVIVSGPNEAGKSTLLDFVTAMLFGFPARRDNPRFHQPVRGGRHGGRLTLAEGRGEQAVGREQKWQIERYASPRKELRIRLPDGGVASEEDLRRALGGADEALFRAVFGIDLTDLATAEPLARDDVRELLFSASILGQRRSAARAMTNLHKQRLELARLRQNDARANRLLAELDDVRRDLAHAGREAGCYPAREADVRQLERAVSEAREDADRSDRRMRELDLLVRLWDVLERRRAAERRLSGLEHPAAHRLVARGPGARAPGAALGVLGAPRACGAARRAQQPTWGNRAVPSRRPRLARPRLGSPPRALGRRLDRPRRRGTAFPGPARRPGSTLAHGVRPFRRGRLRARALRPGGRRRLATG